MSEQAKERIAQLGNFRSRKGAMDALIALGDEAVPALVDALGGREENVRWAVRSVLAAIGGEAVTSALLAALDDPRRREQAGQALREITGQDLGTDRAAWDQFLTTGVPPAKGGVAREAAPGEAMARPLTDKGLIDAAIEGTDVAAEPREGGVVLTVPLDEGRRQRVTVSFAGKDFEGDPLVVVYTECGPAEPENYEWALRQNLRMAFGAIAVRERGDERIFAMVDTHPRATVTPNDIRKSVLLLARKADQLEKALTDADER